MKVMLLKDVYKLGRAGDIKRVADGYGRNYLIPQGLAVLATPGVMKQAERIRMQASAQRQALNLELGGVAEKIGQLALTFAAKAGETGTLYGSVTTQMIAEAISERIGTEVARRQIDSQPLRALGEYIVPVRLTVDLIPEVRVIVYREGEASPTVMESEPSEVLESPETEAEEGEEVLEAETVTEEAPSNENISNE
ncbi:MAG: 50S ribosomal protein L9 [Chloroflexota bacterium]